MDIIIPEAAINNGSNTALISIPENFIKQTFVDVVEYTTFHKKYKKDKDELNQLLNIFKSIKSKFSIDEIDEWSKDLNQSAMFGLFRRDYMTKARLLLTKLNKVSGPRKRIISSIY